MESRMGSGDVGGKKIEEDEGRKVDGSLRPISRRGAWMEPENYIEPFFRSTASAVNLALLFSGRHFEATKFRLELRKVLGNLGLSLVESPHRA